MRENRHNNRSPNNFYSARNENSPAPTELTKKEQDYRHQWQDKYLKSNIFSFRMGQLFGFIYNVALLALVYDLIQNEEKELALNIFAINAGVIAFALLVTAIERKVLSRKPARRNGRNDKRPRPNQARSNSNNRDREPRERDSRDNRRPSRASE
jgi:hypothetical protein